MSEGWGGPEIPLDMQALVVTKHFEEALNMLLRQLAMLHKQISEMVRGAETGGALITTLGKHPFFEFVIQGLVEGEEKFGDQLFRWDADRIGAEAQEEVRDALVYLSVLAWVANGASFPEGTFDSEDADEEE